MKVTEHLEHVIKRSFIAGVNVCRTLNLIFICHEYSTFPVVSHGVGNDGEKWKKRKKKEKVAQIVVSSQARNGVAPLRWIDRKSLYVRSSSQMAALHRNVSLLRGKNRMSHRTLTSARAVVRPRISRDGSRG